MNYYEWSQEYVQSANQLGNFIHKLKEQRKSASVSQKKELDDKIAYYRTCYHECMDTANLLMQRYEGVA